MKEDIIRKLTSRKFWLAVTAFVTELIVAFRGDAELAETMKRIAKDNMYKAVSNPEYARASYAAEMEQGALLEEAKRKL